MNLRTNNGCLWQNHDILLYLCQFIDGQELILFATSCRLIYQTIVDRPDYWERRYKSVFSLGDRREQEWLTWYNWHINPTTNLKSIPDVNQAKQKHLLSPAITNINTTDNGYALSTSYLQYIPNFDATRWFYAYQKRRQTNSNFMAGRFKKQICQFPIDEHAGLELFEANPWYALLLDKNEGRLWSIQHDVFSKKNKDISNGLAWKELNIPLPPSLFEFKDAISYGYGLRRFVVASVVLMTYDDVAPVAIGDPIDELEAQYIRENESKVFNTLNGRTNIPSAITLLNERESDLRKAVLVWPNTGNSSPSIIYLGHGYQDGGKEEKHYLSDIYNEWVLFRTGYPLYPYQQLDLFDLDGNQWIKGPELGDYSLSSCIQFASCNQCQFLVCKMVHEAKKLDPASIFITTQDSQAVKSDYQSSYIRWELFNALKGQSQCEVILSNQITILYWPNATIQVKTYTERMCIITVDHSNYNEYGIDGRALNILMLFFVFGKDAANTSSQSLFDARDYGELLPIDSSDQGHILWSRHIHNGFFTNLYSEKLIILQNNETFDVLDARDGNLLRSIACPFRAKLTPFLGSLCELFSWDYKENWYIDMCTGRIYKPPACLTSRKAKDDTKDRFAGPIEVSHLPAAKKDRTWNYPEYNVSNAVINRINIKDGQYENRERVRQDEEKAQAEEDKKKERIQIAEREDRLTLLRAKAAKRYGTASTDITSNGTEDASFIDTSTVELSIVESNIVDDVQSSSQDIHSNKLPSSTNLEHINLFKEEEEKAAAANNKEAVKSSKSTPVKPMPNDCFGQLVKGREPWYIHRSTTIKSTSENDSNRRKSRLSRPVIAPSMMLEDPMTNMRRHRNRNGNEHKTKHASKTIDTKTATSIGSGAIESTKGNSIEQLRKERLEREKREQKRANELLGIGPIRLNERDAIYHSQYNPELTQHAHRHNSRPSSSSTTDRNASRSHRYYNDRDHKSDRKTQSRRSRYHSDHRPY
ncbi:hypothetical protein BDF19DRAFT_422468 [Syncephalis fuscata]|nr:hypothetical protein BDF19DRAFT_422468 [Syncephalis fuscata]